MSESLEEPVAPTLAEVAKLANVSVASASRALNGIGTRPETLSQVLEAAERVGYVPNASARSLRSKRTGQIAFAMPDVSNPVYASMVRAIQEVARARGCRLVLHSTGADAEEELGILRDLRRRFVDGLILVPLNVTAAHLARARRARPRRVVVIGSIPEAHRGRRGRGGLAARRRARRQAPARARTAPHRPRQRPGRARRPGRRGGSATSTDCAPRS